MNLITIINSNLETLVPIIHQFRREVKRHILFCDNSPLERNIAQKLKNSIEVINKKENIEAEIELVELDEDSKKDIDSIVNRLKNFSNSLYLNAAGSDTSLVAILSHHILSNGGYILAYDKFENTYNKISKINFSNHKIDDNLNLDYFIEYMGYKKIREVDSKEAITHNSQLNFIFKNSSRFFHSEYLIKTNNPQELDSKTKQAFKSLKILDRDLNVIKKGRFGTLFEYFIYNQLLQYNFDDIKIGVEIEFEENVQNEFDILAIKDNHIYTVECKLGSVVEDANRVIYKLDSLIENFGEDSKGLIVNIHPTEDIYKNRAFLNKVFSFKARKRANYNNLEVYNSYFFNETEFYEIIEEFFDCSLKYSKKLKDEPLFLLGGSDLEMQEIKNILIKHNKHYIDKKLSWGAKLSQYIHLLDDKRRYYGIELTEDVPPPKNYIAIDHHNDLQDRPSAIEQVAEILGIELTRYQKLVALNDKGYIPAMEEFGATEVEIELIRQKDREAQGVTQKDEILAQLAIEDGQNIDGVFVVKSYTNKFSPITDRCYGVYDKLLIYTNKELTYYGKGVDRLVKVFKKEIRENKAYYGGNGGFFGIGEGIYSKKEIDKIKKDILKGISNNR